MLFLFLSHPLEAYRMGHAYLYTLAWCGTHGRATHPKMETFSNSHFTENEIKKEKARKAKENRKKRERERKKAHFLFSKMYGKCLYAKMNFLRFGFGRRRCRFLVPVVVIVVRSPCCFWFRLFSFCIQLCLFYFFFSFSCIHFVSHLVSV